MLRDNSHFSLSAKEYDAVRGGRLHARRRQLVQNVICGLQLDSQLVLEIGFGSGALLADLATLHPQVGFTGTEIEPKMVDFAHERYQLPNARYLLADIGTGQLQGRYDLIYSIDVLHHIHDVGPFLLAARQLLCEGGIWLVIEPNMFHPYIYFQQERMRRAGLDEDHFRPWMVEPLLRSAGFMMKQKRYAFFYPGWVGPLPLALERLENRFEGFRPLGGSVVYLLQVGSSAPTVHHSLVQSTHHVR